MQRRANVNDMLEKQHIMDTQHISRGTTRRNIFAMAPAALALAGAATAAPPLSHYSTFNPEQQEAFDKLRAIVEAQADGTHVPPPSPDADLIALCAAFDALERKMQAAFNAAVTTDEWGAADLVADAVREEQAPILDAITSCRPSTLAGFRAIAASLALWDEEMVSGGHGNTNDRLATLLVCGLMGRA